jgi:hypothetical protein
VLIIEEYCHVKPQKEGEITLMKVSVSAMKELPE